MLEKYRAKRDFRRSPEPRGARTSGRRKDRIFVVQEHHARRLHHDFRLELDGVLKSWAIPKGPSDDPNEKRLAVMVEDHPLEYGDFEGTIPKGHYGAGEVRTWDRGIWEPDGDVDPAKALSRGNLRFTLHGGKLKGRWALVRMKTGDDEKDNWLLIKRQDPHAKSGGGAPVGERRQKTTKIERNTLETTARRPAAQAQRALRAIAGATPAQRAPADMACALATPHDSPPEGNRWLHEVKYDGYRILGVKQGDRVTLLSRTRKDWTRRFRRITEQLQRIPGEAILDGEVVALNESGLSSFQLLQQSLKQNATGTLLYFVFDLPWCDGYDLRKANLIDRKAALRRLLSRAGMTGESAVIRYSHHIRGSGAEFYKEACRSGLEGIVSKKASSVYHGRRTPDWLKLKCVRRQEFVIGGFTRPANSRKGFGALLLGYYDENARLRYAGRVGTGFDDAALQSIHQTLQRLARKTPAFTDAPGASDARAVTWVRPRLVAEVAFTEWTRDGRLRHPSFEGLREDKRPEDVRREPSRIDTILRGGTKKRGMQK